MQRIDVGIINVTGYIGVELARLLHQHPGVRLASVTGRSAAGQKLGDVFPHLADVGLTITSELAQVDLAFSALGHGDSAAAVVKALEQDTKVIDVSADFRLNDVAEYERWYKVSHVAPELLTEAVYGLPELYRSEIPGARLVANPGCYPTSAIIALAPALREGLIEPDIVIDSKSGVSGAGRSLTLGTHFAEANEDVSAYALEGHRHLPEIVQELAKLAPELRPSVVFLPHLIPMTRGILTSCYARLRSAIALGEAREIYREFYRDEPFVRVVDAPPHTKQTWGGNCCLVCPVVDQRTQRLVVVSCIDNLVKGGAGQAVQNMNLMLSFPEGMGLSGVGIYP